MPVGNQRELEAMDLNWLIHIRWRDNYYLDRNRMWNGNPATEVIQTVNV